MADTVRETRDRALLERFLRRDTAIHLYALADLDEPFWPQTRWFVLDRDGEVAALAMLFHGIEPPVLYAICRPDDAPTIGLVKALEPELPERLFADIGIGVERSLAGWSGGPRRLYRKMILDRRDRLEAVSTAGCERLGAEAAAELARFYARHAYAPGEEIGRFFDPCLLDLGPYFAIRHEGQIAAAAGVHVCSRRYGVAALGNIATRPDRRGRGLARRVTAAVARELADVDAVGLNVEVDNEPAIRCYRSLGFSPVCRYLEREMGRSLGA